MSRARRTRLNSRTHKNYNEQFTMMEQAENALEQTCNTHFTPQWASFFLSKTVRHFEGQEQQ